MSDPTLGSTLLPNLPATRKLPCQPHPAHPLLTYIGRETLESCRAAHRTIHSLETWSLLQPSLRGAWGCMCTPHTTVPTSMVRFLLSHTCVLSRKRPEVTGKHRWGLRKGRGSVRMVWGAETVPLIALPRIFFPQTRDGKKQMAFSQFIYRD